MNGPLSRRVLRCALALLLSVQGAYAVQPMMRLFTTDDGLVRNWVTRIRQDRLGRLWFCTVEGLSVFDGERFTNYTVADGLPHRLVLDVLDAGDGDYWIITFAGLFRFRVRGGPQKSAALSFTKIPLEGGLSTLDPWGNRPSLLRATSGEVWVATGTGLYRIEGRPGSERAIAKPLATNDPYPFIRSIAEGPHGDLWIADGLHILRLTTDGRVSSWGYASGTPKLSTALLVDRAGHLWVGGGGLAVLEIGSGTPVGLARYSTPISVGNVDSIFQDADGEIWVAGTGLAHSRLTADGTAAGWASFEPGTMLGSQMVGSIAQDNQRHLWVAVSNLGVARLLPPSFSSFTESDGLESRLVFSVFEARDGKVLAVTGRRHILNEFDGRRFVAIAPRIPSQIRDFGWGESSVALQDRRGEWWIATAEGLVRFARTRTAADLAHMPPVAVYGKSDGLPDASIIRLFEDGEGGIWAGTSTGVVRWDPVKQSFQDYSRLLPAPGSKNGLALAFAADGAGQTWIGMDGGGLARVHAGRIDHIEQGLPEGFINGLCAGRHGRLWIASSQGGLGRIDDPAAAHPRIRRYTMTDGLASNHLFAVIEDQLGRVFVAGGHGVDRLDPATGVIRHYLTSDGMPPGETQRMFRDRSGAIWFASNFGLSRYEPQAEEPAANAAFPLVHGVRAGGTPILVSDDGEKSVSGLELSRGSDMEITYGSVDFAVGQGPKYQYRLLPVDFDWQKPTSMRSVQYARLGPAEYTFQVRGIDVSGVSSRQIATVQFRVPLPFWLRWWFVAVASISIAGLAYAAHAYRLRHVVAVQRIRTRLATDLHDDLGSGLAEIAILAEVARQQSGAAGADVMETVAERARELRGTMGDIVWSVDPSLDNLTNVIRRWRQAAVALLGGTSLVFNAPPETVTDAVVVLPDRRRHLLLLFKEAVTNIARHARAARVSIVLTLTEKQLQLRIRDDGCGFDPAAGAAGNGLRSMAHRAKELHGEFTIHSAPGDGTTMEVRLPV